MRLAQPFFSLPLEVNRSAKPEGLLENGTPTELFSNTEMFKVPGWNVPDEIVKSQIDSTISVGDEKSSVATSTKKSKKRKRDDKGAQVTSENVSELYNKLLQGKDGQGSPQKTKQDQTSKKQKRKAKKAGPSDQGIPTPTTGKSSDKVTQVLKCPSKSEVSPTQKFGAFTSVQGSDHSLQDNVQISNASNPVLTSSDTFPSQDQRNLDVKNQSSHMHGGNKVNDVPGEKSSRKRKREAHRLLHQQKEEERLATKPSPGQQNLEQNSANGVVAGTDEDNARSAIHTEGNKERMDLESSKDGEEAKRKRNFEKKARRKDRKALAEMKGSNAKNNDSGQNEALVTQPKTSRSARPHESSEEVVSKKSDVEDKAKAVGEVGNGADSGQVDIGNDSSKNPIGLPSPQDHKEKRKKRKKNDRSKDSMSIDSPAASKENEHEPKAKAEPNAFDQDSKILEPAIADLQGDHEDHGRKETKKKRKNAENQSKVIEEQQHESRNGTLNRLTDSSSKPADTSNSAGRPKTSRTTTLTPVQQKMSDKLISARFRALNEKLYTTPSYAAQTLFANDAEAFSTYHSGFRAQVATWPTNPIDTFIDQLLRRGDPRNNTRHAASSANRPEMEKLPRDYRSHICRVADLGCGDAKLAAEVQARGSGSKMKVEVRSFDLARPQGMGALLVERADITDLSGVGVRDGSFHVAVCCLSLMGTDWVKVADECARILVRMGEVWVAEVKSRFRRKGEVVKAKKGVKRKEEADLDGGWREELEGKEADDDETDTRPFVEVWKRRGFELKGEVDRSNKMFVTMRFVKVAGKPPKGQIQGQGQEPAMKRKFGDIETEADKETKLVEEGKVLKPCLYKTR